MNHDITLTHSLFFPTPKCVHGPHRIPRYSQRLRILYFIKTRDERLNDIEPRVRSVLHGCSEVITSGKLRKVLEVVLAFGNFMNQGRRGNAIGFKLHSLNKIIDTKSSTDREVTLLHYIIKTLESKVTEYSVYCSVLLFKRMLLRQV